MKAIILVVTIFVASVVAQKSAAPTKHPKASKPSKAAPVITCSNITQYQPRTCCPSFPNVENKETKKCGRQCAKQNDSIVCCISNCTLNEIKSINADGTFNVKPLVDFFVKYSNTKNKTIYSALVTDVVQKCIAGLSSNSACPPSDVAFCIYRQLFFQCPDMRNNSICNVVKDTAQTCPGYPFINGSHLPKANKKEAKQADSKKDSTKKNQEKKPNGKKGNENKNNNKNNKNQGKTSATTAATNGTTTGNAKVAQSNKVQKAKANAMNLPKTTATTTTTTTQNPKNTTHKSESVHGALGPNGPGFQP